MFSAAQPEPTTSTTIGKLAGLWCPIVGGFIRLALTIGRCLNLCWSQLILLTPVSDLNIRPIERNKMTTSPHSINVAVLDDYQGVALSIADWSNVSSRANIAVFQDHLADEDAVAERLAPFDVVCIMRERTPMAGSLLRRLPRLKLIASTAPRNAAIDLAATADQGIAVAHTGYFSEPTIELTWALILAGA